jgi:glycosyltransferase involved in cell wall biosynthesis
MADKVLFTVVTICRNSEGTLGAALESLVSQTYTGWEWIMIDGASTDGSVALASILEGKGVRQTVISEPDRGIYEAMNKGVRLARGKYVHFLNADDLYHDARVLEDIALALERNSFPDLLYGDIVVVDPAGKESNYISPEPANALREMVCGCLPHQGCFASLNLFNQTVGLFREEYRTAGDYDWMIRALVTENVRTYHMPRLVVRYCSSGASSKLESSLPESFAVLNKNIAFQQALGTQGILDAYQQQVLSLRLQIQQMQAREASLAKQLQNAKERLVQANQKKDTLRAKIDAGKSRQSASWIPRWLRPGNQKTSDQKGADNQP